MRTTLTLLASIPIIALACIVAIAAPTDDVYKLGPDSEAHAGVPSGRLSEPAKLESKVYDGTVRNYWTYVPAQYDSAKPTAVMVFEDGHFFLNNKGDYRIPIVFDNLIY